MLPEQVRQKLFSILGGLHQKLNAQVVAVAIHHQPGYQIRFAVNDPVSILSWEQPLSQGVGLADPGQKKIRVDRHVLMGEPAQGNLRLAGIEGLSQKPAALIEDRHRLSAGEVWVLLEVRAVDPGMAVAPALHSTPGKEHRRDVRAGVLVPRRQTGGAQKGTTWSTTTSLPCSLTVQAAMVGSCSKKRI